MRYFSKVLWLRGVGVVAAMGIVSLAVARAADPVAGACMEKVLTTPHFWQSDPGAAFPEKGANYCCPTAFSDSLVYLAGHGFPKLLSTGSGDPVKTQIALIEQLATPAYMNTNPSTGTDAAGAIRGLQHLVGGTDYGARIEYRGWRPLPRAMAVYASGDLPKVEWLKQAAADPHAAVWLNVGWYAATENSHELERVGGHWVALLGFCNDAKAPADTFSLLIDNPGRPAPKKPLSLDEAIAAELVTLKPMEAMHLVGKNGGLPRESGGMFQISGAGLPLNKKYAAALIDGAVVLTLSAPSR